MTSVPGPDVDTIEIRDDPLGVKPGEPARAALSNERKLKIVVGTAIAIGLVALAVAAVFEGSTPASVPAATAADAAMIQEDSTYHSRMNSIADAAAVPLENFSATGDGASMADGLAELNAVADVVPPSWHRSSHYRLVQAIGELQSTAAGLYGAASQRSLVSVTVASSWLAAATSDLVQAEQSQAAEDDEEGIPSYTRAHAPRPATSTARSSDSAVATSAPATVDAPVAKPAPLKKVNRGSTLWASLVKATREGTPFDMPGQTTTKRPLKAAFVKGSFAVAKVTVYRGDWDTYGADVVFAYHLERTGSSPKARRAWTMVYSTMAESRSADRFESEALMSVETAEAFMKAMRKW